MVSYHNLPYANDRRGVRVTVIAQMRRPPTPHAPLGPCERSEARANTQANRGLYSAYEPHPRSMVGSTLAPGLVLSTLAPAPPGSPMSDPIPFPKRVRSVANQGPAQVVNLWVKRRERERQGLGEREIWICARCGSWTFNWYRGFGLRCARCDVPTVPGK